MWHKYIFFTVSPIWTCKQKKNKWKLKFWAQLLMYIGIAFLHLAKLFLVVIRTNGSQFRIFLVLCQLNTLFTPLTVNTCHHFRFHCPRTIGLLIQISRRYLKVQPKIFNNNWKLTNYQTPKQYIVSINWIDKSICCG